MGEAGRRQSGEAWAELLDTDSPIRFRVGDVVIFSPV
jgi:hypothetical protein